MEGCTKNGVEAKTAGEIFDLMEKFAEYGFNKSHSAAYGLITVQTAWLKAHHPVEFMAALLTSEKDDTDKVVAHIAEARANGHQVLPPDVNLSDLEFSVSEGRIRFGLGAIKGVGESAIEAIAESRGKVPFRNLFDFCERVDLRRVNRKVIEALVKAGAFDFEKRPRRQLFETIDPALERGATAQRDRAVGQKSLFGDDPTGPGAQLSAAMRNEYVPCEEWSEKERLSYEKEAIGFYVSGHPLHQYEKELRRYARPAASVQRARREERATVAGIVAALRERPTKTGKRMAWITLEDLSGSVDVVCFPGRNGKAGYEGWEPLLKSDEPILIRGTVQMTTRDEEQPTAEIIAEEVLSLREVRDKRVRRLELRVPVESITEERLRLLAELAKSNAGSTPLVLSILIPGEAEATIGSIQHRVGVSDDLLAAMDRLFGSKVAELA